MSLQAGVDGVRNKTDLLMAGYIGLASGLISLVASFGLTACLYLTWGPPTDLLLLLVTPAAVFCVAGWVAGHSWRTHGGTVSWLESVLATPSTWAAPVLFVLPFILPPIRDTHRHSWLHPVWTLWFLPAYLTTYLGLRSKPKPAPRHCVKPYDLTGNVSGRCPECGRPIPLSQRFDHPD